MSAYRHFSETELSAFLAGYELRGYERTRMYNIGTFLNRVNVHSQQERAMWLIYLLEQAKIIQPGRSTVGIVGAGFAGVSACAAALARGYRVDIFERHSHSIYLQSSNSIRKLHPRILDFPASSFNNRKSDLPILNWHSGRCEDVVSTIHRQYAQIKNRSKSQLREFYSTIVSKVEKRDDSDKLQIDWRQTGDTNKGRVNGPTTYDVVILAVGFNLEDDTSYWANDEVNQFGLRGHREICVSGAGDGGLIDAIRSMQHQFDIDDFIAFLLSSRNKKLMLGLQEMIAQATSLPPVHNKTWLHDNLEDLERSGVMDPLFQRVRKDRRTDVNGLLLNGLSTFTEMSYSNASLMHWLLIYSFNCVDSRFNYVAGKFESISTNTCRIQGREYNFDRIIKRHGCNKIELFSKLELTVDVDQPLMSMDGNVPTGWWDGWLTGKAGRA